MTGGRCLALVAALSLAACAPTPVLAPVESVDTLARAPIPTPELPEPTNARPDYHLVSGGETLIAIAFNYGLNYRDVALWNNLRDPDLIQAGQRLRLAPPKNEPAVTVVGKKEAPSLRAAEGTAAAAAASAATAPAAPTSTQKRQTTIIAAATPAAAAENVPLKTTPVAAKYIYSPAKLKELRLAAAPASAAKKAPVEAPAPTPAAAAAPAAASAVSAPSASAPAAVRQRFGVEWSWPTNGRLLGKYNKVRRGVNFADKDGAPVFSSADGKVIYVGSSVNSYGRLVVIQHGNDYLSAYAHNNEIFVREGEQVKRGSRIATFGSSGADRVMLHFEVRKAGKPFDPFQVLPPAAE